MGIRVWVRDYILLGPKLRVTQSHRITALSREEFGIRSSISRRECMKSDWCHQHWSPFCPPRHNPLAEIVLLKKKLPPPPPPPLPFDAWCLALQYRIRPYKLTAPSPTPKTDLCTAAKLSDTQVNFEARLDHT